MEHKSQKQHIIPQVYLKQFGFEKDGKFFVSVLKIGSELTENVEIVDFLKEENVFDLSFGPQALQRHFDKSSRILENRYRTIISSIDNQKRVTEKDWDYLNHIVANMLCRSDKFRNIINGFLNDNPTRNVLLREINMFFEEEKDDYLALFEVIDSNDQLQITIGTLLDHLVKVLRSFKMIVLRAPDDSTWLTSDNPVFISRKEDWSWIVPIDAEIFLPLSSKYCLFMYHEKSKIMNYSELKNLKYNSVNDVSFDTVDAVSAEIVLDSNQYIIFGSRLVETSARSFWSRE